MAKYIVYSETQVGNFSYAKNDMTEAELLKMIQRLEPTHNWQSIKKLPRGKHPCPYCGNIAEGTFKDLLCQECRETFGHSLITEL